MPTDTNITRRTDVATGQKDLAVTAVNNNDGLAEGLIGDAPASDYLVDDSNAATLTDADLRNYQTFTYAYDSTPPDGDITLTISVNNGDGALPRGIITIINNTGEAINPQVSGQASDIGVIVSGEVAEVLVTDTAAYVLGRSFGVPTLVLSQAAYDALGTYDPNILYFTT